MTMRLCGINPELEVTKLALDIDETTSHRGHLTEKTPAAELLLRRLVNSSLVLVKFDRLCFTL